MKYTNKDIIKDGDERLRKKCDLVDIPLSEEDKQIALGLREYVKNSTNEELVEKYDLSPAVGLAAPQVGVLKRMCAVYILDEEDEVALDLTMINPKIVSHSVITTHLSSGEACLSIDEEKKGLVERYDKIKVNYIDVEGNKQSITVEGFEAIAVQHEIDHLDGILFYDRFNKENPFAVSEKSKIL